MNQGMQIMSLFTT